nr:odorant-binding protein 1 [Rhynchaenus maculosus]
MKHSLVFIISNCFCMIMVADGESFRQQVQTTQKKCQANPDTAIDESDFRLFLNKLGPKPNNLGAHAKCFFKNMGLLNSDGNINKADLRKLLELIERDQNVINVIIGKCTSTEEDDEATAAHLLSCMIKHAPDDQKRTSVPEQTS